MNVYHKKLHYRPAVRYLLFFVLSASLFFLFINSMLADRIQEHLDADKELTVSTYQGIVRSFKSQADILYYNRIDVPDVIRLYRRAWSAPDDERAEIRKKLYALLLPVYQNISLYHLKQMHFHLRNADSFLRFHRPDRFGDNLAGVRDTVTFVNRTHRPVAGFEEGRIFNGYRFVYPLFEGTDYLGSVEVSISMQTILEAIRREIDADTDFIIRAQTVASKVFKEEQKNYEPAPLFEHYLHEKALSALHNPATDALIRGYIRGHGPLTRELEAGQAFNFCVTNGSTVHIITFIPVVNAISQKSVAYIIVDRKHDDVLYMRNQSDFIVLTVISLLAVLFYLLYRATVQRHAIEMDKRQLQSLIDLQKNIVVLTDGKVLKFANRFFFETFNYESLEQFVGVHACICDLFIRDERFFHLGKVPPGRTWLSALMETRATKRIVKMLDREGTPRIYTVAVNAIAGDRYVVTFTDISLTITNQRELEQRASRDKLTDAYNREFLDANFYQLCRSARAQQKLLGIIMVDLDHFKRINDTYGHNRGDEVLRTVVSITRQAIRQEDLVIRWGGEEFLLLLLVDSIESLAIVAEGIRERIATAVFEEVGQVTASFGLTLYCEGDDLTSTVARSDKALYEAKASGRNAVVADDSLPKTCVSIEED